MLPKPSACFFRSVFCTLVILFAASVLLPAVVQGDEDKPSLQSQWDDMLHYITIAKPLVAQSYAKAILENPDAPAKEIYLLSISPGCLATLRQGARDEALRDVIAKIEAKIEEGYGAWRSNPEQIEKSIEMMGGTLRGMLIGKQRLVESGEHAIPLLIARLVDEDTPELLRDRIVTMLHEMGRPAVRPFSVALQSSNPQLVVYLAQALGRMEYPAALPRLAEAYNRKDLRGAETTAKILANAIRSCGGGTDRAPQAGVSELFFALGEKYYGKSDSILPDHRNVGDTALVWFWKDDTLLARPVPAAIFCDVYAMRMARLAIKHDPKFAPAVPLWLSACIRREIDLPEGATDTLWVNTPGAGYYALASSPRYLQQVLAGALEDKNVEMASKVISILAKNSGAKSLTASLSGGAMPLVGAMSYPDGRVRYLAAETLANSMPAERFEGYQMVMALMNEAIGAVMTVDPEDTEKTENTDDTENAEKPRTAEQRVQLAIRAARTIRNVGIRGGGIFDLKAAVSTLGQVVKSDNSELSVAACEALAVIDDAKAQQLIVDYALQNAGKQADRIAAFNAASESVRRFSCKCTSAQAGALAAMVSKADGNEKLLEAAAELLGAMNLSSRQVPELILSTDKID